MVLTPKRSSRSLRLEPTNGLQARCPGARSLVLFALCWGAAAAQDIAPQMSPIVTFDAARDARPPTERPLSAAELKLIRERADAFYDVLKLAPSFRQPTSRVTLLTSWAVVEKGAVSQSYTAYWSSPRDVRRRADSSLWPVVGGGHNLLYFNTNWAPTADKLEDRATRGNFARELPGSGGPDKAFAMPRVLGEVGGGTLYADMLVLTRDGRSALEPAPLGPLLEAEQQRLRKLVTEQEAGFAKSLQELEVSMTPAAVAARRAKRAERWSKETRDPAALAKRLDAAERSDESDDQRQKERLSEPAVREPKSVWWGPRLALQAAEQRLGALDAAGRSAPACGRTDPAFSAGYDVRYEPAQGAAPDCLPMVRVRPGLVEPRRPTSEVQMVTVWFRESVCGLPLASGQPPQRGPCENIVPLMREVDWSALRRTWGW